jgi:hypothetical protein
MGVEAVALADDRAERALRDLLDAARRVDEQLSHGSLALSRGERERLRALLADTMVYGERAIDATVQRRLARLRGRRGWRYGRDRGGRIQTPWGEQLSRRWQGALLEWAIDLDDAARAADRTRFLGLILGRVADAHDRSRERQQAADDARAELLELCAAAANVPGISLALLARELQIARQTLHENLTRLQRDGPLDPAPRWHELTPPPTPTLSRHPDDTSRKAPVRSP